MYRSSIGIVPGTNDDLYGDACTKAWIEWLESQNALLLIDNLVDDAW